LQYRVQNKFGWSNFSPISEFVAADIPSEPTTLILLSVSATHIEVEFDQLTIDDGGLAITDFVLEISEDSYSFIVVDSYTDGSSTYILTAAQDGLIEGKVYTLRWFA
jgi:hypothetical protein